MQTKKKGITTSLRALSQVGSFGLTMGAAILMGYYFGSWLDRKFATTPWCMLLFLLLFMVGAFIKFMQSTREVLSDNTGKKNQ
ncbi:MAG: AtpZ/AtpI family protein [Deltaproteobacteria bacterium]|nr:AtpZ/AtpI family protein [Deltaproteobacteria bacterium]